MVVGLEDPTCLLGVSHLPDDDAFMLEGDYSVVRQRTGLGEGQSSGEGSSAPGLDLPETSTNRWLCTNWVATKDSSSERESRATDLSYTCMIPWVVGQD
jgi:hypothetical protein